ncbi:hypothetical protein LCGC14_1241190 [marine sediment metagenome]|uniref:Uncharacterized protein n=1 Tax=marine sediment metagenome TaxID=412755 RepID=A0A0F9LSZ3_9ZZZZ
MKKVYYIGIVFGLMFLYIIPIGKSTSGTRHLYIGDSMTLSFSVKVGDVIKGKYDTLRMDGLMVITLAWAYGGNNGILIKNSGKGVITINIASGSGIYVLTFINLGFYSGNLNYDIYVVRGDSNSDSIPSFNPMIIIGIFSFISGISAIIIKRRIRKL